jgi:asparagine synthase (glutamine-hydrolysing)
MCGISGIYCPGSSQSIDQEAAEQMLKVIHHRGPDDQGSYQKDNFWVGFKRLSIIDLSTGHQPMFNEDLSIVVVCNGEIYNYKELRSELVMKGHSFRSASDIEVIVHLYEEYGEDFISKLRGMFGIAVWDSNEKKLLLGRDRIGIKPLYYSCKSDQIIFSSEIKSIAAYPGFEKKVSAQALSDLLCLKYVPTPHTLFDGIKALRPGYLLVCGADGSVREKQYWDLDFENKMEFAGSSEAELVECLTDLVLEAVESHLMSDVPFGAFLSGGIDSSLVVALMSKFLNQPVKTYSIGYEDSSMSELPYAQMVADMYHTDHHDILVSGRDLIDLTESVVWHLDQPIADPPSLAMYKLSLFASQDVKMVLTGEGGDELFAGYARYAGEKAYPFFQLVPPALRKIAARVSGRIPKMRRLNVALNALSQDDTVTRLTNWFALLNYDMRRKLVTDSFYQTVGDFTGTTPFADQLAGKSFSHQLDRMLYVDTKLWLVDDLLARGDKMTMAASIEGRVPFLDHKLVEFAASLPPEMKVKGLERKYLLKKVAEKWLPRELVYRKKKGFPMPIGNWFRGEARDFLRDHVNPQTIKNRAIFDVNAIECLLKEHENESKDHSTFLWTLLNIEIWYRLFID